MDDQNSFRSPFTMEARYKLLVEAVTDYAIYMLDPQGFVASWNAGAQRLKGYTEAEIIGRHFSLFYPDEDVAKGMPARTLATAASAGRFEAEGWRVSRGGKRFWAHVVVDPIRGDAGELLGFAKVTRDLSERQVAEEALRRSEEQFRLLVEGVTDYAIYLLDANGIVTNWNSGAQRIKGYRPEEIVGSHFSRFYRPEDQAAGHPTQALATAAREGRFESEGWRIRKDGSRFWASVVIDPVRDAAGQVIGFAKVTRDVTEKREAQLALDRAREALFQSQKLDAIGQLTGGVAHDFNNLLMVILSSLELLRRRVSDDAKLQHLVDNAVRAAKRGASLTQRMLAFARRQDLKPVAVSVPELVHGMRDMLERTLGSSIDIELTFPPRLRSVLIDPNQLELAILNLAVNARDAMPEGGRLEFTGQDVVVADPEAKLAPGAYVRLSLIDTGAGMDAETLDKAMEPFFTTKGAGKGTGLGLPMVHGLAMQSGGQLLLSSVVGSGTIAELWLPVAASEASSQAAVSPNLGIVETASLVVVAVDDDGLVLSSTVAMLEDIGHTVLPASSAAEALQLILSDPRVALVITDQVMPGMTGVQLIEALRASRPAVRAILATGFGELPASFHRTAMRLAKPFDQADLANAIHKTMSMPA